MGDGFIYLCDAITNHEGCHFKFHNRRRDAKFTRIHGNDSFFLSSFEPLYRISHLWSLLNLVWHLYREHIVQSHCNTSILMFVFNYKRCQLNASGRWRRVTTWGPWHTISVGRNLSFPSHFIEGKLSWRLSRICCNFLNKHQLKLHHQSSQLLLITRNPTPKSRASKND